MEVKCPTCGNVVIWEESATRPFCSERCQLIDFGAWADEEYRVPVEADQSARVADAVEDEGDGRGTG